MDSAVPFYGLHMKPCQITMNQNKGALLLPLSPIENMEPLLDMNGDVGI
jgi:hypothetical protein